MLSIIKSYLRKTISVFLAALILMTAWVFVAPTSLKAEAVNAVNSGFTATIASHNCSGSHCHIESVSASVSNISGTGFKVNVSVSAYADKDDASTWGTTRSWSGTIYVNVNGVSAGSINGSGSAEMYNLGDSTKRCDWSGSFDVSRSINSVSVSGTTEVDIPASGSSSATFTAYPLDKFGVKMAGNMTFSNNGGFNGSTSSGSSYDTYTITLPSSKRTAAAYTNYTITATVGGKSSSCTLKTYSKYRFSYDGNNGSITPSASHDQRYGLTIGSGNIPTSGTRIGYEYIGMYESNNKNSYAFTKPTAGSTSGYTGQLTTSSLVNGDKTWYAAWWAKNITVRFLDNDGQEIGHAIAKAKYDKEITYTWDSITWTDGGAYTVGTGPTYHKKPGETGSFDLGFKEWVVVDAEKLTSSGSVEYSDIFGETAQNAILKGNTIFQATYTPTNHPYTVDFYGPTNNRLSHITNYHYEDPITKPADQSFAADDKYTYTFRGWTAVSASELSALGSSTYYIVNTGLETSDGPDGYTDSGRKVSIQSSWNVVDDKIFVPVFGKYYINYTVTFVDAGTQTTTYPNKHYGDTVNVPATLESYTSGGYRYRAQGWSPAIAAGATTVTVGGNDTYTMQYGPGEPAVYTVNFYDYNGTLLNEGDNQFTHGVDTLDGRIPEPTRSYREGGKEYTWSGDWQNEDGDEYLGSMTVTADAKWYPVYEEATLFNVNFYNGEDLVATKQQVAGGKILAEQPGNQEKEPDDYATQYAFAYWALGSEDGEEVTPVSVMTASDVDLYAHYNANKIEYRVNFNAAGGWTTGEGDEQVTEITTSETYYFGDTIDVPADPDDYADNTYRYQFKGWDKTIPTKINSVLISQATETTEPIEGSELVKTVRTVDYNAEYRKSYQYYNVKWLNDDGSQYKSENYIYNASINAPYQNPTPKCEYQYDDTISDLAFLRWEYSDGRIYERGDKIQKDEILTAVFGPVDAIRRVTFINDDGTELAVKEVPYGTDFSDILAPVPVKVANDTKHFVFAAWTLDGTDIDEDIYQVTANVTLQARYDSEDHTFALDEVTTKPTFWTGGSALWTCPVCGKHETRDIPELEDDVAPSVALFIASNSWRDAYEADYENATPVAPMNFVSIATFDKGTPDENYNPEGVLGSGTYTIEYKIVRTAEEASHANAISDWVLALQAASQTELSDEQLNSTVRLLQVDGMDDIEDGGEFLIVTKITDRLGNIKYGSTGLLVLDKTAPAVEVISENQYGNKHCLSAEITISDNNEIASVKVDGEILAANDSGKYIVTESGIHQAVVTDIAGNTTSVNFEIVGSHTVKTISQGATCTEDGFMRSYCTVCGKVIAETVIEHQGHQAGEPVHVESTSPCTEAGRIITYCTVCFKEISNVVDPEAPATGHTWTTYYEVPATCTAEGFREEVCSVCDETNTVVLTVDPDAHSYYRATTVKATCTTDGKKSEVCKHCGFENIIETYPATGHVEEGEPVVTTPATCTEAGVRTFYCKYHGPELGDDAVVIRTEPIDPLGHDWKYDHVVAPTSTTEGYTVYICRRCGDEDHRDPTATLVEYTVTFNVEGTETTVSKYAGETLSADDAPDTTKAADATYRYTFAGWVDADENAVTLPLEVNSDLTLTATYTKKAINYTVTLYKEDGIEEYAKIGFNKNGDVVDLSSYTLSKAADVANTYTFDGWSTDPAAASGSMSVTIDGANISLYPIFKATTRTYNVIFAIDNHSDPLYIDRDIPAGESAQFVGNDPTKAFDNTYHYSFSGWDKDYSEVLSDMMVYAQFDKEVHNPVKDTTACVASTCTTAGKDVFKCECDYTKEVTIPLSGHTYSGDPEENAEGKLGWTCEVCGEFIEDTTTYTVKFMPDEGSIAIKTIAYLPYGTDISDRLPDTPTKASDGNWEYTFDFWADEDGNEVTVQTIVKADATYYAHYAKAPITHFVVFAIDADHILKTFTVDNGSAVRYGDDEDETTPVADPSTSNSYGHLVFDGWNGAAADGYVENVTTDLYITAKFKRVAHDYTGAPINATCTEAGGTKYTCACGYSYTDMNKPALGHDWVLVSQEGLTANYVCSRCPATKTEQLPDNSVIAVITVIDNDGHPVEGAKVSLYDGNTFINSGITGSDGVVRLKVPEAKEYTIVIEASNGSFTDQTGTVNVNGDGSTSISGVNIPNQHCSCACHKDGLWGTIFRFFHKIIKLITGKFTCCDNPDPRYYN